MLLIIQGAPEDSQTDDVNFYLKKKKKNSNIKGPNLKLD